MILATPGRVSDCSQGGHVHGGAAESQMSLGIWRLHGQCAGAAPVEPPTWMSWCNLRAGRASFGRGRASSAPVAGALSSVHPGDTSCGVMTGHPAWPHAVVKTVGLRATGCRGFNAWRRGQPWALSKATCESANRPPAGCGAAGAGDDGIAAPFVARNQRRSRADDQDRLCFGRRAARPGCSTAAPPCGRRR
jgi:hypothetical protein